ncbi:Acg family FMN-binding oxidoreductase [Pseudonocardia hydrocarbonoxydans]|uniref:NAD(P)H nitroreductase n=1 Tax=Pseudonocardia hydrocarbonoxydans TaxID=76726 RepID=A0A4Y3WMC8_9PSEU|nr:NAD(P)H nitroreductase [Pseudonocardia hydrocarbonoxydans]GEC20072.1 NAD(P)H nitroreductase [Pseudonocardia hydrocarbonoxydans]
MTEDPNAEDPNAEGPKAEDAVHPAVRAAVEAACRAPSVHNTQPWSWWLGPHRVDLYADRRRRLGATDPDGRDLHVSCGAALHHARVALAAAGFGTAVTRLPDPADPDHLAVLETRAAVPGEDAAETAAAIAHRTTDRRRYRDRPVPDVLLRRLRDAAAAAGATLHPVTEPHSRAVLLGALTAVARRPDHPLGKGIETALWTGWSDGAEGIPAASLLHDPAATTGARRLAEGTIEQPWSGEPDGALFAVLGTASDGPRSWLDAGEALSAVALLATRLGMASCPLSEPLEVPATRAVLREEVLAGALHPQLVLRLGWAPDDPLPPTPRRPPGEVVRPA